jgi:23S rRNA-/tRNA-specific pseudouridylate synthase
MLTTGSNLDAAAPGLGHVGTTSSALGLEAEGSADDPALQIQLPGVSVVLKPPYWEVDAKGQLSGSGRYLSRYMQRAHAPCSPVLFLPDFEYGFVHRLDVPSSGLILTGTHFEGYCLLQWQMHTYTIGREYSVLLSCLVPSALRDINVQVDDFLPGHSFVHERGRPAETHLKNTLHTCFRRAERFSLVCIAIYTGRRHQIRVHTQWEGYPTVTDEKYSHRAVVVSSPGLEEEVRREVGRRRRGGPA